MNKQELHDVSEFLIGLMIKHEIYENVILVNRDSICYWQIDRDENQAYERLLAILHEIFHSRFAYTSKTDEWLMLDKIA